MNHTKDSLSVHHMNNGLVSPYRKALIAGGGRKEGRKKDRQTDNPRPASSRKRPTSHAACSKGSGNLLVTPDR